MYQREEQDEKDEELVTRSRAGDSLAEEQLLKRYSDVVKREVRFLFLVGAETEDLIQEAMIGLVKAIREFSPEREASFRTYAVTCIRNQIRTAIRDANRKKHHPLNSYVSIYEDEDESGSAGISDRITEEQDNPENIVIRKERLAELEKKMQELLSPLEQRVAALYLEGLSHAKIAEQLGKPERSVNNALTRIRTKLKN